MAIPCLSHTVVSRALRQSKPPEVVSSITPLRSPPLPLPYIGRTRAPLTPIPILPQEFPEPRLQCSLAMTMTFPSGPVELCLLSRATFPPYLCNAFPPSFALPFPFSARTRETAYQPPYTKRITLNRTNLIDETQNPDIEP